MCVCVCVRKWGNIHHIHLVGSESSWSTSKHPCRLFSSFRLRKFPLPFQLYQFLLLETFLLSRILSRAPAGKLGPSQPEVNSSTATAMAVVVKTDVGKFDCGKLVGTICKVSVIFRKTLHNYRNFPESEIELMKRERGKEKNIRKL